MQFMQQFKKGSWKQVVSKAK